MMGSESIDLSLSNLYKCWRLFRCGKIASREIIGFEYFLEDNLRRLQVDLISGNYRHGGYRQFEVVDSKRRTIRVADVRDRIVHRLVYEYLKPVFDKTFIYDIWSCREGKGLIKAVKRSQEFLRRCPASHVWRSDVRKFFDCVDKEILLGLVQRRIIDDKTLEIIKEIIFSGKPDERENKNFRGIPIGNLTSQIFANIYLNELDRFAKHDLRIKRYLRYGDDFIILADSEAGLEKIRLEIKEFLHDKLRLEVNSRHDIIIKTGKGLKFLGVMIHPWGRQLDRRNHRRLKQRINIGNLPSYRGLIRQYEPEKLLEMDYFASQLLNDL